ncbi:glycine cleavage system protein R [Thalassomonas actiniarum]|uniref:Glycine cleavage system transcriptional repressor n=1 Tax=Thalassomonas actiniarum TaxID=485447 RepID=A0AAF0C2Q6_9GAMM|nr:ACT domain-containing protein [Thalassomonas actiniarum]WDE00402.1 amino acid-binding protein [Thalassomonas actiniarum]
MNYIVISFIGPDRPGLVDKLSNIINRHQGNWQTSSMHHLSGFFAGVLEVAVSEENSQALINALNDIPELKTQIETGNAVASPEQADIVLELTANDREGIIQEITSVIHRQGGNLLKLVSSQSPAAHSGQTMFKAKTRISVNEDSIDELISALENIADDLMVDISR